MISVYEDYQSAPDSLSMEEMARLHGEMVREIGNDEDSMELYEALIAKATEYMSYRSNWYLWSREERLDKDSSRTSCHDVLIGRFNQLARFLKGQGKAAMWREALGNVEENPKLRKRIGDFACYLVFVNSLLAR